MFTYSGSTNWVESADLRASLLLYSISISSIYSGLKPFTDFDQYHHLKIYSTVDWEPMYRICIVIIFQRWTEQNSHLSSWSSSQQISARLWECACDQPVPENTLRMTDNSSSTPSVSDRLFFLGHGVFIKKLKNSSFKVFMWVCCSTQSGNNFLKSLGVEYNSVISGCSKHWR